MVFKNDNDPKYFETIFCQCGESNCIFQRNERNGKTLCIDCVNKLLREASDENNNEIESEEVVARESAC